MTMLIPDEKTFLSLTAKGNLVPVYREILGDLDTPVSVYNKLAANSPYGFLLESVEGEEKVARFSFVTDHTDRILSFQAGCLTDQRLRQGRVIRQTESRPPDILKALREIMAAYRFVGDKNLPGFCGGWVGYWAYDMVRIFEPTLARPALKSGTLPDMLLMLARHVVIFDHRAHRIKVVFCVLIPDKASRETKLRLYRQADREIQKSIAKIHKPAILRGKKFRPSRPQPVRSTVTRETFEQMVRRAKKRIREGDIIQTVLSQRFDLPLNTEPFYIYRCLRAMNPSPYLFYLKFNRIQMIGSSPELLVRCENGVVETRPIAGTRPRGRDEAEDRALAQDLLADPKERAEHVMLVDLGRNDLGRVCRKGSVQLTEFMAIEKYSHVMHMVSHVKGRLKKGCDSFDVLKAAFPAGTVSGAPKIRAMEIIDALEKTPRGPYAGGIAYFSFGGNLDSCITIRTIVVEGKTAWVQAGAGIVADSRPAREYQETVNKARAQILAIQKAHELTDDD